MKQMLPFIELPSWYSATSAVMLILFVGIICWVCRGGAQKELDEAAHLPLSDGER